MTDKHEIALFIAVNETGDFVFTVDSIEDAINELQSDFTNEAIKSFALTLRVELPKIIEVTADLPSTDGPVTVTISG